MYLRVDDLRSGGREPGLAAWARTDAGRLRLGRTSLQCIMVAVPSARLCCWRMTFEDIRSWLEHEGWPVEVVSGVTLRSSFQGSSRTFHLYVHLEPPFVTFAVIPFARLPTDPMGADAVARRLLRLNREINMAKFSADEDGDVVLSVEYRLADLDPSEVRDAASVLSFYADRHHAEVQELVAQANASSA